MPVVRSFCAFAIIAALAFPLAVSAQAPPPAGAASPPVHHHRHGHHRSLIHALHAVNLSAAQRQRIAAFRAEERRANLSADPATKHANAAKMRHQIMGILTPGQRSQLASAMHRPHAPAPGSAPMPNPAPSP
jgi:Spy/CpxP family protein refolding chaperone